MFRFFVALNKMNDLCEIKWCIFPVYTETKIIVNLEGTTAVKPITRGTRAMTPPATAATTGSRCRPPSARDNTGQETPCLASQ